MHPELNRSNFEYQKTKQNTRKKKGKINKHYYTNKDMKIP